MAKIFKIFLFSMILALAFGILSLSGLSSEFGQARWLAEVHAEQIGTLHVVITPQEAIDDGAQWRVDGGAWRNGGAYVVLEVSSYTVDFKIISGWAAPSTRTASIVDGQITEINGVYSQNTGALAVTLTPQ